MKKTLLPAALLSAAAVPVFAETTPSGFSYSGDLVYESTKANTSDLNISTIDVRLGYGYALDNGLTVGVNTRFRSVDYDAPVIGGYGNSGNYSAYVSGSFGTISVGRVGVPSGDVQDEMPIASALLFNVATAGVATGGLYASYFETIATYYKLYYTGLRYDASLGDTTYSVAYLDIQDSAHSTVVNAAVRGKIGENNTVYASFEQDKSTGDDNMIYSLGSETNLPFGKLGIRGRHFTGGSLGSVTGDVYFTYKLFDKLTITPEYTTMSFSDPGSTVDWFSLTVKYELPVAGAFVYAAYTQEDNLAPNDLTTVGLRVKF